MKDFRTYLTCFKNWVKDGYLFLINLDIEKIEAQHLFALLLAFIILYFFSIIIVKIFKSLIKFFIIVLLGWLLWMMFFDRSKYNQLFCTKCNPTEE
ncbi:hypothetical protein GvMRE_IIg268 [endosymbiont GvMRE of Glomus versiforme]|nr:hypothetical protein GvMRE_IIg268 [endosymbiont GvMRE of Glomus versiforme]